MKQVGYYAWVRLRPLESAASGGWFSSWLIGRGRSVDFARKLALGLSAAMMPVIVFVTHVPVEWAILLFSIAFFSQQSWSTLVMIVPTDLSNAAWWHRGRACRVGGAMGGLVMNRRRAGCSISASAIRPCFQWWARCTSSASA